MESLHRALPTPRPSLPYTPRASCVSSIISLHKTLRAAPWPLAPKLLSRNPRLRRSVQLATYASQSGAGIETETAEWAMQDFYALRKDVETTAERVDEIRAAAGLERLEADLLALEKKSGDSALWDDPSKAQETLLALNDVKDKIKLLTEFKFQAEEAETIVKLTEELESIDTGLLEEASKTIRELSKALDRFELTQLLSGPYDKEGAVISISAGAGGTDAQDWADMLLRMYVRWGEKQRYKTKVVEKSMGEEAGIKSATLELEGRFAYGYLSGEKGTHRIVRQSPFNTKGLHQTSFAGIEVMPLIPEDSLDVDIPEEDLDISYSRAGGKGGQNINKVETAVRIVHIPTGVAVRCTEERSQLSNIIKALNRLKAKLLVIAEEQRASEIKQIRGDMVKAEWGQQIRNYVFYPYKLVKDVRTGTETTDIASVMDEEVGVLILVYDRESRGVCEVFCACVAMLGLFRVNMEYVWMGVLEGTPPRLELVKDSQCRTFKEITRKKLKQGNLKKTWKIRQVRSRRSRRLAKEKKRQGVNK